MKNESVSRICIYKQIIEAKLFIDTHFKEKINLEIIANQACFSKFHFHRIFKACYFKTPLEYLTYLRLKEAKILLSKQVSTQDVCHAIGFESVSSFIKLFKRNELITPSEFGKLKFDQKEKEELYPLSYIPSDYAEYLGWK